MEQTIFSFILLFLSVFLNQVILALYNNWTVFPFFCFLEKFKVVRNCTLNILQNFSAKNLFLVLQVRLLTTNPGFFFLIIIVFLGLFFFCQILQFRCFLIFIFSVYSFKCTDIRLFKFISCFKSVIYLSPLLSLLILIISLFHVLKSALPQVFVFHQSSQIINICLYLAFILYTIIFFSH